MDTTNSWAEWMCAGGTSDTYSAPACMQADAPYLTLRAREDNVVSVMIIADNAQGDYANSVTHVRLFRRTPFIFCQNLLKLPSFTSQWQWLQQDMPGRRLSPFCLTAPHACMPGQVLGKPSHYVTKPLVLRAAPGAGLRGHQRRALHRLPGHPAAGDRPHPQQHPAPV